jgi:hypothetical protein
VQSRCYSCPGFQKGENQASSPRTAACLFRRHTVDLLCASEDLYYGSEKLGVRHLLILFAVAFGRAKEIRRQGAKDKRKLEGATVLGRAQRHTGY